MANFCIEPHVVHVENLHGTEISIRRSSLSWIEFKAAGGLEGADFLCLHLHCGSQVIVQTKGEDAAGWAKHLRSTLSIEEGIQRRG